MGPLKPTRERRLDAEWPPDWEVVQKAMGEAVREALLAHKRAGNPIVIWRDGRVVWLQPHEIPTE